MKKKKNILICSPNYFDSLVYLPYVHALLKNFAEKDPVIKENYFWQEPIFLNSSAEQLLQGRDEANIDVLGLSCYLWNWTVQLEIGSRIKAANPNCLIVFGGPHPDWNDEDFFIKYPFIDIVVKNEGEQPFYQILLEALKENPQYHQISSLIIRDVNFKTLHTGPSQRMVNWDPVSVWQTSEMKMLAEKYRDKFKIGAVWETSRGCPYQCSFCDWGSATYSKIRQIPEARLEGDLEFFASQKILKIFIADSNFGIFPRDIQLANRVVHFKKQFGYPTLVYWSAAKNKAEPIVEIAKAFLDNGLDDSVVMAFQSTSEKTIIEMGRGANSLKTHKKLSEMIDNLGAPKIAQIILGSPGESAEEFMDSLHEIIGMNFHRSAFVINYTVLPNAPIAKKERMQHYQIKTITRPTNRTWGHKTILWKWKTGAETIIVGHDKMSIEDWVTMSTYKTHIMCLHHLGLTRLVSRLFNNILKVPYGRLYRYLFDRAFENENIVGQSYKSVRDHFADYLINQEGIYAMQGIDSNWFIDHESALFCKLMLRQDELVQWLRTELTTFAQLEGLPMDFVNEAIEYQINMLITPVYDPAVGRVFNTEYDFYGYFQQLRDWDRSEIELVKKPMRYFVNEHERNLKDQIVEFNWHKNGKIDFNAYQHAVIVGPYRRYMSTPIFEKLEASQGDRILEVASGLGEST